MVALHDLELEQLDVKITFLHDDILITAKSMSQINILKKQLSDEFEIKDLSAAKKILRMEITRDRNISLNIDEEMEHMSSVSYLSAVGSIIYAMVCTRPNLSHAVIIVSRYMACPEKEHWQAVKWILRYLKDTTNVSLTFDRAKMNDSVVGYVDLDFTGDLDKRRSLIGYLFTLSGSAIS
ncbi:secreted RxLR effector protein 161-like [Hevea brasiliensis]|uniref:secreted RxLR effector protein 161-like n=1 Tax=Hevea brasiliensis TaxID=3981 RepID=UPI0025E7CF40|nr:secreted RxLR effector protein 161-like [Hevea brasiliensis]